MTVKMRMGDVLNMLMLPKSSSHAHQEKEEGPKAEVRKTSVYLSPEASEVLEDLAKDSGRSRNTVINDAILFYNDRGEFLEKLIKRSVLEALHEVRLGDDP